MRGEEADLELLLRELDPARDVDLPDGVFTHVQDRMRSDPPARRPPVRRVLLGSAGAVVAAAVLVGGPALAFQLFQAQTGIPVTQPGEPVTEVGDGKEWIDLGAPDIVGYARTRFPYELPLPAGIDPERVRVHETNQFVAMSAAEEGGVVVPDSVIAERFAVAIYCLWLDELDSAADAGDTARLEPAREIVIQAPEWEAVQEVGTTQDGVSLQGHLRIAARRAEQGATALWRFLPGWAACGPDRRIDFYTDE